MASGAEILQRIASPEATETLPLANIPRKVAKPSKQFQKLPCQKLEDDDDTLSTTLALKNTAKTPLVYKVKANHNDLIQVKPATQGMVMPGTELPLEILVLPDEEIFKNDDFRLDLHCLFLKNGETVDNVDEFWQREDVKKSLRKSHFLLCYDKEHSVTQFLVQEEVAPANEPIQAVEPNNEAAGLSVNRSTAATVGVLIFTFLLGHWIK